MKSSIVIALALAVCLIAGPVSALVPGTDPSIPSRFVNHRATYRGVAVVLPPSSSAELSVESKGTLGEDFPSRPTNPTYVGRMTGYATLDILKNEKAVRQDNVKSTPTKNSKQAYRDQYAKKTKAPPAKTMIKGNSASKFRTTAFTPKFVGRWTGDIKTAAK